mmetsp:Transcript_21345/g.62325  ORF Transcript_21345/g.62325 Transcript_21345/m.62325 type:complete len:253 (-) Transcript_21345:103-861(-)
MQWLVSKPRGETVARRAPAEASSASSPEVKPSWSPRTKTAPGEAAGCPPPPAASRACSVASPSSCNCKIGRGPLETGRCWRSSRSLCSRPPAWYDHPLAVSALLVAPCSTARVRFIAAANVRSSGCMPRAVEPSKQRQTDWSCSASQRRVSRRTPWLVKMAAEAQRASRSTRPSGRLSSRKRPCATLSGVRWQTTIRSRGPLAKGAGDARSKPREANRSAARVLPPTIGSDSSVTNITAPGEVAGAADVACL